MISKKIIFLSCVLLIFLSIGNISAIDVNNTIQSSNVNLNEVITSNEINEQDVLSISDENEIYGRGSSKDLQKLVDNAQGTLDLNDNYYSLVDYYNQIELPQPNIEVLQSYTLSDIPHALFEDFVSHPTIYGKGLEKPLVHVYNVKFKASEIDILGKKENTLEVVGTMEINTYNNLNIHQIIVDKYEIHENSFDDLM